MKAQRIHIIGAGLAGTLLAILLVRRGHSVRVFEKRPDPRRAGYEGGRSINLALAYRGLYVLQQAGLDAAVMPQTVMMRGRMVHDVDGRQNFLRYGKDDSEVIWSIHRGHLNVARGDVGGLRGPAGGGSRRRPTHQRGRPSGQRPTAPTCWRGAAGTVRGRMCRRTASRGRG